MDGDGDIDIVSGSFNDDKIAWYENLGNKTFSNQMIISTSSNGVNKIYIADLDGDGDNDILAASFFDNKIAWYENLGNMAYSTEIIINNQASRAWGVFASDIDNDGNLDILSTSENNNEIAWYENLTLSTTNFQNIKKGNENFTIFPNPSENGIIQMNIPNLNKNGNDRISCYDINGKVASSFHVNNRSTTINLSSLENGVYFIRYRHLVKKVVLSN